jgi:uncharacterized repeat protein (TIGR01451 family)
VIRSPFRFGLRSRVLAAVIAALVPVSAFADYIDVSGPGVVVISTAPAAETFSIDLGTVCTGATASKTLSLALVARSHPDGTFFMFANGSTVNLGVAATTGTGLSATIAPPSSITLPANWSALPDGTMSSSNPTTVSLNTSTTGAFSGSIVYSGTGVQASGVELVKFSTLLVTANVQPCGTPDVKVEKTAAKASVNAGETVSFSIVVSSIGSATANNVVLSDTLPSGLTWTVSGTDATTAGCAGSYAGGSTLTCNFGSLAVGASRTVNLSATTAASNCGTINNTATVTATADSNASNNSSSASTSVVCQPSAKFAPTQTTCADFRDGTSATLTAFNYNLKNGAINNVAPGVAFYYVKFTAPASSFTVTINQTDNGTTPAFGAMQLNVFNAACSKIADASGTNTISVTGATVGQTYIVSLKIDPSTVVGSAAPTPATVTYTYVTSVNGVTVPGSSQSVLLQD